MCSNRLAAGEAPACVQACPNKAIRITLVDTRSLALQYRDRAEDRFLPGAPPSEYTLPTTRYTSAKPLPPLLRAADREELRPQPAHTPLVFMLVFSQLSAGLFAFEFLLRFLTPSSVTLSASAALTFAACVAGVFAMGVGGLHLGRPLGAWRSFLGLRRSWLSREIVAFGVFLPLAALHTVSVRFPEWTSAGVSLALAAATVFTGLLGVFCSAMVYHDTRREFWWLPATAGKFFGSVLLLGAGGTLLVLAAFAWPGSRGVCLALSALLPLAGMCKLAVELRVLRHLPDDDFSSLHKTALLLTERFGLLNRTRVTCLVMGAVVLPAWIAIEIGGNGQASHSAHTLTLQAAVAFLFCLAGELIERRLFFTAVQPVKMPGAIVA
jgi:DMSO reductase anchor subunit